MSALLSIYVSRATVCYRRGQLDAVLKIDLNILVGDAAFAGQMKLKDAMDAGTELFTKGVKPEDFQRTLAAFSPDEVNAMRQGARVAIGDALDQARQGTLAGARSMFGKASANRAKLDALFPNAGDVFDAINGEAAMRSTEQSVKGSSLTAERRAVQEKYRPGSAPATDLALPLLGEAVAGPAGGASMLGAKMLFGHLNNAFTQRARNRLEQTTAQGLAATGPEQDNFLNQIGGAYQTKGINNAFTSGAAFLPPVALRGSNPDIVNMLTRGSGQPS
jgi:hypothetical protein